MKKFVLVLVLGFAFQSGICQEFEVIRHQVKIGETVRMLSKRYKVEPAEIYRLNKFAIDGIKEGMVLELMIEKKEVPVPVQTTEAAPSDSLEKPTETLPETISTESESQESEQSEISHTVAKGETLYSLSKQYNVTVDEIKAWNEQTLTKGLQSGQVLIIKPTIKTNVKRL